MDLDANEAIEHRMRTHMETALPAGLPATPPGSSRPSSITPAHRPEPAPRDLKTAGRTAEPDGTVPRRSSRSARRRPLRELLAPARTRDGQRVLHRVVQEHGQARRYLRRVTRDGRIQDTDVRRSTTSTATPTISRSLQLPCSTCRRATTEASMNPAFSEHVASDTERLNGQVTPDLPALLVDVKNLF